MIILVLQFLDMKYTVAFLILISLVAGCTSGKKALEKGDYDTAVSQAIQRLRSNDNSKKASATLKRAYSYSVDLHNKNIASLRNSVDPFKWDQIVREYEILQSQYEAIQRCPGCRQLVPNAISVSDNLQQAKLDAASSRYDMGMEAMQQKENRLKAIEAHQHFFQASHYIPRFRDTESLIEEALYFATLRVVVEPIPAPSKILKLNQDFFSNKVNEYLHRTMINQYVQFFTPQEVKAQKLEWVDHVIRMEFERFNLGSVSSKTYVEEISRDSVVLKEQNGEKIYGTVKAKLKINEKSITGGGLLDFQIRELDRNKVISQEKFPSEYEWKIQWATFTGDERALSEDQKDMIKSVEIDIPGPQRMFEEFADPLYEQVIRKLNTFYRNY